MNKNVNIKDLSLLHVIYNIISILIIILVFCVFYREQLFGNKYIPFDSKDQVYPFVPLQRNRIVLAKFHFGIHLFTQGLLHSQIHST